jgi:hypothetical protein
MDAARLCFTHLWFVLQLISPRDQGLAPFGYLIEKRPYYGESRFEKRPLYGESRKKSDTRGGSKTHLLSDLYPTKVLGLRANLRTFSRFVKSISLKKETHF